MHRLVRLVAMQKHEYILLGKAVVAYTELLTAVERLFESLNGRFGTGRFDLVAARYDTHLGMLVLKTQYIGIIHPVKGRRIEGVL